MQQFLQPKNALQRATELRSVGQTEEAFETLHRTITDRKFRYVRRHNQFHLIEQVYAMGRHPTGGGRDAVCQVGG